MILLGLCWGSSGALPLAPRPRPTRVVESALRSNYLGAMRFPDPLIPGRLLRRYKRFLSYIELDCGEVGVAHFANPGALTGSADGWRGMNSSAMGYPASMPFCVTSGQNFAAARA